MNEKRVFTFDDISYSAAVNAIVNKAAFPSEAFLYSIEHDSVPAFIRQLNIPALHIRLEAKPEYDFMLCGIIISSKPWLRKSVRSFEHVEPGSYNVVNSQYLLTWFKVASIKTPLCHIQQEDVVFR